MNTAIFRTGILFALTAVILGAFGAHALKNLVSASMLDVWHTGIQYQMYHSLALIVCAVLSRNSNKGIKIAVFLFITGIVLFSGSLYAIVVVSMHGNIPKPLGIVTPLGGLCFIAGWIALLFSKF